MAEKERGVPASVQELLRIVHYIDTHPGVSRYEISEALGIHVRTLVRKLGVIEQALQVKFDRHGTRRVMYRIADFGLIDPKKLRAHYSESL